MSWEALKSAVTAVITANGNGEITGQILQDLMNNNLIPVLGKDRFLGIAEPSTVPPAAIDSEQFYFASTDGTYSNFGGVVLSSQFVVLSWSSASSSWNRYNLIDLGELKDFSTQSFVKIVQGPNKIDLNEVTPGRYQNSSGFSDDIATLDLTDFMPVVAGETYYFSNGGSAAPARWVAYFDADFKIVDLGDVESVNSWTIPPGVSFQRVSYLKTYLTPQIEKDGVTDYQVGYTTAGSKRGNILSFSKLVNPVIENEGDFDNSAVSKATLRTAKEDIDGKYGFLIDTVESPNLLDFEDTTAFREGKFISSGTGIIQNGTGWACISAEVSGLSHITLSGSRGRVGLAFHTDDTGQNAIPGTVDNSSVMPLTKEVPSNATHVFINVYSSTDPSYFNLQLEEGISATDYIVFGGSISSLSASALNSYNSNLQIILDLDGGESSVSSYVGAKYLTRKIELSRGSTNDEPGQVVDQVDTFLNGELVHSQFDEAAPLRLMDFTIGGTHGYQKTRVTNGGDKDSSSVGSIWREKVSLNEFVLVKRNNFNTLEFTSVVGNLTINEDALEYVSGTTNDTSDIVTTNTSDRQWYPVLQNHSVECYVDGRRVSESGTYGASDSFTIKESYEVMDKDSLVASMISGNFETDENGVVIPEGDSVVSVNVVHEYKKGGKLSIYTDFTALNDTALPFQDIMFGMSNVLDNSKHYIPKTLPFTHQGFNYDFTELTDLTGDTWTGRPDFTPDRTEGAGILADRVLMLDNTDKNLGFAIGLLPLNSASIADRRTNASRKAMQLQQNKKVYLSTIDRADKTTFVKGDHYGAVVYKNYFEINDSRTGIYFVDFKDDVYVYADWHDISKIDNIDLPLDYVGKELEVIETRNSDVLTTYINGKLIIDVNCVGGYGYAVLKLKTPN